MQVQRGSEVIALLFNVGARQRHCPVILHPSIRQQTRYLLYKRLGGPQSRSGRVRKISSPPGFDPRTYKPVASLYRLRYLDTSTYAMVGGLEFETQLLLPRDQLKGARSLLWFQYVLTKRKN